MKKSFSLLIVTLCALFATSCCPCRKASHKAHQPLLATTWVLEQIDGQNVASDNSSFKDACLILGNDGSFSGYGGCNSMGGKYVMTPSEARSQKDVAGKIEFGDIFSTKRMCPNDQLEMNFFRTLDKVDSYVVDGEKLLLLSGGELRLVFRAQQP